MKITSNYTKLWTECLVHIKKSVSEQAYDTWFDSLSIIGCDGSQLTLQVPNRFHYEWLEQKYSKVISDSVGKTFGQDLSVNYSVLVKKDDDIKENVEKIENLIPKTFHRASQLNNRYTFTNFIDHWVLCRLK